MKREAVVCGGYLTADVRTGVTIQSFGTRLADIKAAFPTKTMLGLHPVSITVSFFDCGHFQEREPRNRRELKTTHRREWLLQCREPPLDDSGPLCRMTEFLHRWPNGMFQASECRWLRFQPQPFGSAPMVCKCTDASCRDLGVALHTR